MSLFDAVQQHITPDEVQRISQELGTDTATTEKAIQAALPNLVSGVANTAQQPGGEQTIHSLSSAGGDVQSLGGLGGALGGALGGVLGGGGGLGGILGQILGQDHATVSNDVQQKSGLDAGKAGKLLILLAPLILRAIQKHQSSQPRTA